MELGRAGQIITFYSYKGGTGRSMALANAAWVLASNGKHVLVVDWDLEAPGLHRYFHPFLLDKELTGTPGVLDLMWDFAAAAMDPDGSKAPDWYEPYADVEEYTVSLRRQFPEDGAIDILGAGVQDVAYATRVGSFDWGNFYTRLGGGVFLEAVKRSMKSTYDYVLIDSRTGLSDTAGICTVQLPDMLVVGFTLNNQSIAGASAVANSVRDQRKGMPIFPVPMRVEDGETAKLEAGRDYARASFASLLDSWDETSRDRYWGDVEVRYRMLYAYEEILAAVGERPHSQSILAASERLVSYLTQGEVVETVAMDEVERRRLVLQFERPAPAKSGADIYLSYHHSDRAWAQWVLTQLEDAGYSVLVDVRDFEPGSDVVLSMRRAQESAAATVVLLSPAYGSSEFTNAELTAALRADPSGERGRLIPVRISEGPLPRRLRSVVYVDLVGADEATAQHRLLRGVWRVPRSPRPPAAVRRNSGRGPARFPGSLPTVWNVPPRNPNFVGRSELLQQLAELLQEDSGAVALVGLGGVGKSQIAVEYAHRHAADYDVAWWVNAHQPLASQLMGLTPQLLAGADPPPLYSPAQVLALLGRLQGRWLLVFDGAEDPDKLEPVLAVRGGHLLITSRYTGWGTLARLLPVAVPDRQESIALLSAQIPSIPPATADQLAAEIGDLPLAAAQAAAFLAQTRMPPTMYLSLLGTRRADLLARDDIGERGGSVRTAVELSMARLREESPAAVEVLELASCLGPAPIPLDLLRDHSAMLAEPLRSVVADELAFAVALAALTRYSLGTWRGESLEVHRLVQDVLRNALPGPTRDELKQQIEAMLGATEPGNPENPANWPGFAGLLPHVLAVDGDTNAGFRRLTLDCGRYLLARGDAASCLRLADNAAARYDVTLGSFAEDTLAARHLTALASWKLGDNARSVELNETVFFALRIARGEDHPTTLASGNNLAISLGSVGRYDEAVLLAKETSAWRRRVLGEHHPATLASMTTVVALLIGSGKIEEARANSEDLLGLSRMLLGPDHPSTLVVENNLAVALAQLGEHEASVALGEDVLARRQRVLGEQHPDTLRAMHNLAVGLAALGRSAPAQQLVERAAEGLASRRPSHCRAEPPSRPARRSPGRCSGAGGSTGYGTRRGAYFRWQGAGLVFDRRRHPAGRLGSDLGVRRGSPHARSG